MHRHRLAQAPGRNRWLILALLILAALPQIGRGAGLTAVESDGYLEWLHAVTQTLAARAAADQDEGRLLYPFGQEFVPEAAGDPLQLIAIGRALASFEKQPRLLRDATGMTALHALNLARNYRHLAEFDSALVWYDNAAARDSDGDFTSEIATESLATAAAVEDSVAVIQHLLNVLGTRRFQGRESELIVAYRFLLGRRDEANLRLLTRTMAADTTAHSGRLVFWQAYALSALGAWEASLTTARTLLPQGGLSYGLTESQRTWFLVAVPDLLFLTGDATAAEPLYKALAASTLPGASRWARLQLANYDLLAGRHQRAGAVYGELCDDPLADPWRSFACEMASLADDINRIREEGATHGTASLYQP